MKLPEPKSHNPPLPAPERKRKRHKPAPGVFAVFSCLNLAIRPADKIAANDADVRKYGALLTKLNLLDAPTLQQMLDEARLSDTIEVEPLRAVAYNDVVMEIDEPDSLIELSPMQKLMGVLA